MKTARMHRCSPAGSAGQIDRWVDASIALYLVALALGGLGGQRPKDARLLATRLAREEAPHNGELRALLDDRISLAENYASLLLVLTIVALMCFKP